MASGNRSSPAGARARQTAVVEDKRQGSNEQDDDARQSAQADVAKETDGRKRGVPGRRLPDDDSPFRQGGILGGKASAARPAAKRSASAKKAAATRRRNAVKG